MQHIRDWGGREERRSPSWVSHLSAAKELNQKARKNLCKLE